MTQRPSPKFAFRRGIPAAVGVLLIGALLAMAASQARPGPRLARKGRLVDLIRSEDARARALRKELDQIKAALAKFEDGESNRIGELGRIRKGVEALSPFAGLKAVRGPGVRVILKDSTLRTSPTGDPNDLVIHEQDLQAVVNALWAGGAEAVSVNGERVTSTSAIRCVGNTLLLHGAVYSPPYRVAAIGDTVKLVQGLDEDPLVERFRIAAQEFRLGFEVKQEKQLELPAFRGIVANRFAELS